MDIPTWDVDNASETLNRKLFGSGRKKKVQFQLGLQKTSKLKSSKHLKSSSSENVIPNREVFISKVKGKFGKKKTRQEDDNKDSSSADIKSLKKKKKKTSNQVTNRSQTGTSFAHKVANKTKLTMSSAMGKQTKVSESTSELKTLVSKTKKLHGTPMLNQLPSLRGLPHLKSQRKRKFVLPTNEANEEVENNCSSKSSKLTSSSLQTNNECVVTSGKKRKWKKWDENQEESFTNKSSQSTQNKDNETTTCANGVVSSSNQIRKTKHNKPSKQKLKSINCQPQPASNIVQKDLKMLTRRQPGTLRERMLRRLQASRFRYLNEQMYCSKGDEAFEYFKTDPQAFQAYHHGYRQQVAKWPMNPLTTIISSLKKSCQVSLSLTLVVAMRRWPDRYPMRRSTRSTLWQSATR